MNRTLGFILLSALISGCRLIGVAPDERAPVPGLDTGLATMRIGSSQPAEPVAYDPAQGFEEIRALWVVRFSMTSAEAVQEMVLEAERSGINTLIIQVRGRADAFYRSSLEPWGESVVESESFDPLE